MECREAHPLLIDVLYGDLPVKDRADLERHLAGCVDCREGFETLRSGKEHLSLLPRVESNQRLVFSRPERVSILHRIRDRLLEMGAGPRWAAAALAPALVLYALVLATGARIEITGRSLEVSRASRAGADLAGRATEGDRATEGARSADDVSRELARPPVENVSSDTGSDRALLIQEMVRRMKPEDRQALARALLGYYEERTENELLGGEEGIARGSDGSEPSPYRRVRAAY